MEKPRTFSKQKTLAEVVSRSDVVEPVDQGHPFHHHHHGKMTEVLQQLTDHEQQLYIAEKDAATRVRQAEAEVSEASEKNLELRRTQEQELKVCKAQNEKKLRDISHAIRAQVQKAHKESATFIALAEVAEQRQQRSEAHVTNLKQKIQDLESMLKKRAQASDVECYQVRRAMESRIERVYAQADERIQSMAEHAQEVCAATGAALQTMDCELNNQMLRASIRAEGRVRFKELKDLAITFRQANLSKEHYVDLKDNLIDLWHAQTAISPNEKAGYELDYERGSELSPSPTYGSEQYGMRSPTPTSPSPTLGLTSQSPASGRTSPAFATRPRSAMAGRTSPSPSAFGSAGKNLFSKMQGSR